eukprot:4404480-Pyramimonas_sp.AAC.1
MSTVPSARLQAVPALRALGHNPIRIRRRYSAPVAVAWNEHSLQRCDVRSLEKDWKVPENQIPSFVL